MQCKNCKSQKIIKNGTLRNKQRYQYNLCGYNFARGDLHIKPTTELKPISMCLVVLAGKIKFPFSGQTV